MAARDGESGHEHGDHEEPLKFLKLHATRPGGVFGGLCGAMCFCTVLCLVLIIALGSTFLPFSTEVPLYLRHHVTRERYDAITEGLDRADVSLPLPTTQLRQQNILGKTKDSSGKELDLEIFYVSKEGSAFTPANLARIQEIEQTVRNNPRFKNYCQLAWTQEQLDAESTMTAAEIEAMNNDPPPCKPHLTVAQSCQPAVNGRSNCLDPRSVPAGVLDCAGAQCDYGTFITDEAYMTQRLNNYSRMDFTDAATWGPAVSFYQSVDTKFGGGSTHATVLRSVFYMATPVAGFGNANDDPVSQEEEITQFIFDELNDYLLAQGDDKLDVWYNCRGCIGSYIQTQLTSDASKAFGSIMFVLFYMVFMNRSWFLSLMGMAQILSCFPIAYMLYFMFGQRYFGVFNVLTIFIILGIGADDIFVLLDTWTQSGEHYGPGQLWQRISHVWKHAANAMLVTSATTMASFLANASSSFPAISTFGIFAAVIVLVNYCAVISYYPAAVCFYHTKWESSGFCCGIGRLFSILKPTSVIDKIKEMAKEKGMPVPEDADEEAQGGGIEVWFRDHYAPSIIRYKWIICVVGTGLLILICVGASGLQPDPEGVQLFGAGNNFYENNQIKKNNFARGGSISSIPIRMQWGIQRDKAIDRDGSADTDMENLGKPNWMDWSLAVGIDCMIHFCDKVDVQNSTLGTGGASNGYVNSCFARDLRDWVLGGDRSDVALCDTTLGATLGVTGAWDGQAVWADITGCPASCDCTMPLADVDETCNSAVASQYRKFIYTLHRFLFETPRGFEDHSPYIRIEETGTAETSAQQEVDPSCLNLPADLSRSPLTIRFVYAELKLAIENDMEYTSGIEYFDRWEAFWEEQYAQPVCRSVRGMFDGFQEALPWSLFFVNEKLIQEAFQGIALSLVLAWIILVLATRNWKIATVCVYVIGGIVAWVICFAVGMGWKLGVLESINLVMVPGMSVDYVAHLAEAYGGAPAPDRGGRVKYMLGTVGVSVVSGAFSTLGACMFLFTCVIIFFFKFGLFIFATIAGSLIFSLVYFAAILAAFGPEEDSGNWYLAWKHFRSKATTPSDKTSN